MKTKYWLLYCCIIAIITSAGASASLTTNLTAYWTQNTTAVVDVVGSYTATATSGLTSVTGIINNANDFGTTDYATISSTFPQDASFTFCTWYEPQSTGGAVWQNNIFARHNAYATSWFTYALRYDTTGRLAFTTEGNAANSQTDYSATIGADTTGSWKHACIAFNDSTKTKLAYFNGAIVINTTYPISLYYGGAQTAWFGRQSSGTYTAAPVEQDEAGYWNRVLTTDEIVQLYNGGSGCTYPFAACSTPPPTNFTITANNTYTDTSITEFNATVEWNGTTTNYTTSTGTITTSFLENSGEANITITAYKYFDNSTINHDTVSPYQGQLHAWTTIYARNGLTNDTISNFTIEYNSTSYTANNNYTQIPLYNEINANVSISGTTNYNDDSTLLNASPYLESYTFELYPDPSSVQVYAYDADNGNLISENITLTVSGALGDTEYTITNGTYYVANLTAGNYTFSFEGTNYSLTSYLVAVGNNTYQTLYAYLSQDTGEVIFTLYKTDTTQVLEGAAVAMARSINSTMTTVESRETDISGRTKFQYVSDIQYRFTITLSGYETKVFFLDPILFDQYNVYLDSTTTVNQDLDLAGVSINLEPEYYTQNTTNNMSLEFIAPSGNLQSYGYTAEWPGGSGSGSGTNAYGGTLLQSINPTTAGVNDRVNITYWYQTTASSSLNHTFSRSFVIIPSGGNWTFIDNKDEQWGLGVGERVFVTNGIGLLIAGAGAYYMDALVGLTMALLVMGYLAYIGFIPLWALVPTLIAGFVLIVWRSNT